MPAVHHTRSKLQTQETGKVPRILPKQRRHKGTLNEGANTISIAHTAGVFSHLQPRREPRRERGHRQSANVRRDCSHARTPPQGRESLHVDEIGSPTALTSLWWSRCHFASSCRSRTAVQSWCRGMGSSLIKSCEKNGSGRGKGSRQRKTGSFFFVLKVLFSAKQPATCRPTAQGSRALFRP